MKRVELIRRVRNLTRDLSNSIFREEDIIDYLNEGVNRCKQILPELKGMKKLVDQMQEVEILPEEYHDLLSAFSASRCFSQDERHYQATTFMNEFETKMQELQVKVQNGEVVLVGTDGIPVPTSGSSTEYVRDIYFSKSSSFSDFDEGVEGVE